MEIEHLPQQPGIYLIRCKPTGDTYVGKATNLQSRAYRHRNRMLRGRRTNRRFADILNIHGVGAFEIKIIETCDGSRLDERERYWIAKLRPALNYQRVVHEARDVTRTSFDMPIDLSIQIKIHALQSGVSVASLMGRWISEGLDRDEQAGGGTGKRR